VGQELSVGCVMPESRASFGLVASNGCRHEIGATGAGLDMDRRAAITVVRPGHEPIMDRVDVGAAFFR